MGEILDAEKRDATGELNKKFQPRQPTRSRARTRKTKVTTSGGAEMETDDDDDGDFIVDSDSASSVSGDEEKPSLILPNAEVSIFNQHRVYIYT
jgi:hypothetical protein